MIKAAIIGATGYVGQELLRLLSRHPKVEVVSVGSRSYEGQPLKDVYPLYEHVSEAVCTNRSLKELSEMADVVFLALPHGIASLQVTPDVLEKTKVVDLGADFRLKDLNIYEHWYQVAHHGQTVMNEAVYGLVELHREAIKQARLIGNPGCYTTCSILTLAPLVQAGIIDADSIIIDAKSGVTGAGRTDQLAYMFCECTESIKPYKVASHRHTPEIEQELGVLCHQPVRLLFTPNLVPMNRGILAVCYARLNEAGRAMSAEDIRQLYRDFYRDEYFVRLTEERIPDTKWVKGTNFCDIGVKVDRRTNRVIAMGAIDNLIKGAAGQAVQNMNLMFDLPERTGIDLVSDYPV